MPVIFDLGVCFEYYTHVKALGEVKIPLKEAIEKLSVQKAAEKIGTNLKGDETVYLVPSVTGRTGFLEIKGKKFYEY